eukprot:1139843-Pelagomonas_calceolata.AAC.3
MAVFQGQAAKGQRDCEGHHRPAQGFSFHQQCAYAMKFEKGAPRAPEAFLTPLSWEQDQMGTNYPPQVTQCLQKISSMSPEQVSFHEAAPADNFLGVHL